RKKKVVNRLSFIDSFKLNFIDASRWQYILTGLRNTLVISLFAVIVGVVLGFLVAIIRSTHDKTGKLKLLNLVAKVYLTVVRGTPVMVQLLIVYYVIFAAVDINKVLVAILAF